jgi:hypothetical protein
VPLAWLCKECAADPAALARFVGDFRAAFRGSLTPQRFAAAPDRDDPVPGLQAAPPQSGR